jgi:uncharacterized membrane protein
MSDDINKENDYQNENQPPAEGGDNNFDEFKPDEEKYRKEQEALEETGQPIEPTEQPVPEEEIDARYKPQHGGPDVEYTPTEEELKQRTHEEIIEEPKLTEEEVNARYRPQHGGPDVEYTSTGEELKQRGDEDVLDKTGLPEDAVDARYKPQHGGPDVEYTSAADELKDKQTTGEKTVEKERNISEFEQKAKEITDEDTRTYAFLCHLCNALILTTVWLPVIIFFVKTENKTVKFHALQSALYGLAAVIVNVAMWIIISILMTMCIGCFLAPFAAIISLGIWGYAIYVTVVVYQGQNYRIPILADLLDDFDY